MRWKSVLRSGCDARQNTSNVTRGFRFVPADFCFSLTPKSDTRRVEIEALGNPNRTARDAQVVRVPTCWTVRLRCHFDHRSNQRSFLASAGDTLCLAHEQAIVLLPARQIRIGGESPSRLSKQECSAGGLLIPHIAARRTMQTFPPRQGRVSRQ